MQIRLFLTINAKVVTDLLDSVAKHEEIVDAIVERDKALAAKLMRLHINNAERIMMDFMKNQEA